MHALDSELRGYGSYRIPSRTDAGTDGFDSGLCWVIRDPYQVDLRVGSRVLYAWPAKGKAENNPRLMPIQRNAEKRFSGLMKSAVACVGLSGPLVCHVIP